MWCVDAAVSRAETMHVLTPWTLGGQKKAWKSQCSKQFGRSGNINSSLPLKQVLDRKWSHHSQLAFWHHLDSDIYQWYFLVEQERGFYLRQLTSSSPEEKQRPGQWQRPRCWWKYSPSREETRKQQILLCPEKLRQKRQLCLETTTVCKFLKVFFWKFHVHVQHILVVSILHSFPLASTIPANISPVFPTIPHLTKKITHSVQLVHVCVWGSAPHICGHGCPPQRKVTLLQAAVN